ncbi:hypothetical protein PHLCEN_2v6248 [Hermanssonia centrifuga]|nr:hypothetical protein PHLCEN_2v6248 [Hermanssonia centrifuga]
MDVNSKAIFYEKKTALEKGDAAVSQQVDEGKDLLSLLLRANINVAEEDRLPEAELVAQLSSLVFAATDTTSNALSRILHLLALNQDVQQKLRAEISEARNGEDLTFDQLMNLPFLDAVCRESLRLFAPVTFVSRETRQDTVMPLSEPIHGKDGNLVHQIVVPKDTTIIVGIRGCNHSKAIWGEDVLEWKPERWLSSLPESVSNAKVPGVYANLMTFLGGGRSCIGFKFSQLEMKVALSVLLDSFKFSLSNKDIVWNLAGVSYPTVGAVSDEPSLPLKVEAIAGKMNEA